MHLLAAFTTLTYLLLPPVALQKVCTGRNNIDPVCVTWPRGGTQKSRVGQEQYPRTAGQIAIWASGGSESGSERPPAAPRSIGVHETIKAAAVRPKGMEVVIMTGSLKVLEIRLVAPGLLSIRTCVHGYCSGLR
ncbi:hypothetical protein T08_16473 [Trichinella sp. T8]|nr:hypothetical protein T08_16473 [Trichinella sp. T8]